MEQYEFSVSWDPPPGSWFCTMVAVGGVLDGRWGSDTGAFADDTPLWDALWCMIRRAYESLDRARHNQILIGCRS